MIGDDLKDLGDGRYGFSYGEFAVEADTSGSTADDSKLYLGAAMASLQGGIGVWRMLEFASGQTHDGGIGWACRLKHAPQVRAVGRTRLEAAVSLITNAVSAMGDVCRYAGFVEMMSEGRIFGGISDE